MSKGRFTLEQATKAWRKRRGIAPIFFNLGARCQRHGRFTPEKGPVPIV